ncbi:MAG: hypothetical protein CMA81_00060 [Euryarchaeota archaeon]|nr:hypothetical protein [Euryarchaeota archaeon]
MKSQGHKIHPGDCKGHEALSPENKTPKYLCKKRKLFRVGSLRILFRLLRDHFKPECSFILVFLGCQSWNAAHVYAHVQPLKADIYWIESGVRSSLPPPHRNFYYNPFNVIVASDRRLDSLLSAEQKENADAFPD